MLFRTAQRLLQTSTRRTGKRPLPDMSLRASRRPAQATTRRTGKRRLPAITLRLSRLKVQVTAHPTGKRRLRVTFPRLNRRRVRATIRQPTAPRPLTARMALGHLPHNLARTLPQAQAAGVRLTETTRPQPRRAAISGARPFRRVQATLRLGVAGSARQGATRRRASDSAAAGTSDCRRARRPGVPMGRRSTGPPTEE